MVELAAKIIRTALGIESNEVLPPDLVPGPRAARPHHRRMAETEAPFLTMLYAAAAFLTALTFASLAYAADREKHYTFAAMLSAGAWLFASIFVLVCVVLWVWP